MVRGRVLQIDTLIPTFRSLFKDLNYLEGMVNAIKQLYRPEIKETSLRHSLQCNLKDTREADTAWKKLFLYNMRNYYRIRGPPIRSTILKAFDPAGLEGCMSETDEARLYHFANYIYDIRFVNCELWTRQPVHTLSRDDDRKYDAEEQQNPALVTYVRNTGAANTRRSGRPYKEFHREYSKFLWINNMEATNEGRGEGITNFFVRKAVYRAFFEPWEPPRDDLCLNTGIFSLSSIGVCFDRALGTSQINACGDDGISTPSLMNELFGSREAGNVR